MSQTAIAHLLQKSIDMGGITLEEAKAAFPRHQERSVRNMLNLSGMRARGGKWVVNPEVAETMNPATPPNLVSPPYRKPFKPLNMQPHPRASELREMVFHTVGFSTPHYKAQ
jgi:hypothetical protein